MRTKSEVIEEMSLYGVSPETIQAEIEKLENELYPFLNRGGIESEEQSFGTLRRSGAGIIRQGNEASL